MKKLHFSLYLQPKTDVVTWTLETNRQVQIYTNAVLIILQIGHVLMMAVYKIYFKSKDFECQKVYWYIKTKVGKVLKTVQGLSQL